MVPEARILTCDWPTSMLQQFIPTTLQQSAEFLLGCIEDHLKQNQPAGLERPLLLIPSCLGGIVLLKALEIGRNRGHGGHERGYSTLPKATRGIIFLATPFHETAFKDMPELILKIWAAFNDKTMSTLINYTREPSDESKNLVIGFVKMQKTNAYNVFTF
ncbi:hypothetical protein ARSEF4850_009898 [Beauveria asiatica]